MLPSSFLVPYLFIIPQFLRSIPLPILTLVRRLSSSLFPTLLVPFLPLSTYTLTHSQSISVSTLPHTPLLSPNKQTNNHLLLHSSTPTHSTPSTSIPHTYTPRPPVTTFSTLSSPLIHVELSFTFALSLLTNPVLSFLHDSRSLWFSIVFNPHIHTTFYLTFSSRTSVHIHTSTSIQHLAATHTQWTPQEGKNKQSIFLRVAISVVNSFFFRERERRCL